MRLLVSASALGLLLVAMCAGAETVRIIRYTYDAAGNVVGVTTGDVAGAPQIDALEPAFINRGQQSDIVATGRNLFEVTVATPSPEFSVTDVRRESSERVGFRLSAPRAVTIGSTRLEFSNRFGSADASVQVLERIPVISTQPSPLALRVEDTPRQMHLGFDGPFERDMTFAVSIADSRIAEIGRTTVTLPAGDTQVALLVRGLIDGTTTLDVRQQANAIAVSVNVYVSAAPLPNGNMHATSNLIGVTIFNGAPPTASVTATAPVIGVVAVAQDGPTGVTQIDSRPVGVSAVAESRPSEVALITAKAIGVTMTVPAAIELPYLFATTDAVGVTSSTSLLDVPGSPLFAFETAVGVVITTPPPADADHTARSASLGVSSGLAVDAISPLSLARGSAATISLRGVALDQVTDIAFAPGSGLQVTGALTSSMQGTELAVPVTVEASAATGPRVLLLTTPNGVYRFQHAVLALTE